MFRTVVSLACAVAVFASTAASAGERHDRDFYDRGSYSRGSHNRDYDNSPRIVERVRTIDFSNHSSHRRERRSWERRDAARDRYWRDRRDYRRDRDSRPSIIIIPRISF